jgi:hypothetical protein
MIPYIFALLVAVWFMMFYLGFRLIDIKHDLRAVRLHMERISRKRIR